MRIHPFKAVRPADGVACEVAALPYDVYDRAEAAAAVAGKPLSFLNIDRPETQFDPEMDMYADEVYEKGRDLLCERTARSCVRMLRVFSSTSLSWTGAARLAL